MTVREPETRPVAEDEFSRWLAVCDEQLAAGAAPLSPDDLGVPSALRGRLEEEVAWCQIVRQLWPHAADATFDPPVVETPRDETVSREPLPTKLDRFELRHELGRGAFGVVFLAYDPALRRDVALKVPRKEVVLTPELRGTISQRGPGRRRTGSS